MTYKEYYETLHSIQDIKCAAADDIINPDRIDIILDSANQVLNKILAFIIRTIFIGICICWF